MHHMDTIQGVAQGWERCKLIYGLTDSLPVENVCYQAVWFHLGILRTISLYQFVQDAKPTHNNSKKRKKILSAG